MSFDLVSTNAVDDQTKASARLLAAVIAQALHDLSIKPTKDEYSERRNMNSDAIGALIFFGKHGMFKTYAKLIGINPDNFLEGLATSKQNEDEKKPCFTEAQFRACRARMKWWDDHQAFIDAQSGGGEKRAAMKRVAI
jgi:hypothetical protein